MFALTGEGAKDPRFTDPHCTPAGETRHAYGCTWYDGNHGDNTQKPYPFDSYEIEISYQGEMKDGYQQGYLHNVTPQEVAITVSSQGNKPFAGVKAQAIAARTFAYYETYDPANPGQTKRINNSAQKQVYIPYRYDGLSAEQKQRVDTTVSEAVYMTLSGDELPILAHYGEDNAGTTTTNPDHAYLLGVKDPISAQHGEVSGTTYGGMSSKGDSRWAFGHTSSRGPVPPGDPNYPHDTRGDGDFWSVQWNWPFQILAHYYTGVSFQNTLPKPPELDRFNVLKIENDPILLRKGELYRVDKMQLQNTGVNSWTVTSIASPGQTCADSETRLSYHLYQTNNVDLACDTVANPQPGGNACFEGYRNALCVVGSSAIPSGMSLTLNDVTVMMTTSNTLEPGWYRLRWDVEFQHLTDGLTPTWGSRLQVSPAMAEWPTQDVEVFVGKSNYPDVSNLHSDSHQVDQWSDNPSVSMSWTEPDDGIETTRYYYRWPGVYDWQETSSKQAVSWLPDGNDWEVEVYSEAADGETNNAVTAGPFKIDTKAPTATLTALPDRVITSEHLLTWDSGDSDGSSVAENQLSYQINGGAWPSVSGVSDPNIKSVQFDFPGGQHGDTFTFCLEVVDEVGRESEKSCSSTRYSPDPEFSITPLTISRMKIYSDTTPLVETLQIQNVGGGVLDWTATTPTTWTVLGADTGTAPSTAPITVTHPLTIGVYSNIITFTGPSNTYNNPQVVTITINAVKEIHKQHLPIIFK